MNKQIKWGAIVSYLSLFINILIGVLYTPWVIHSIGKADYGLYTLALSVINIFVFDFGLSSAITRFVSKYNAEGRQDKVNNFLSITVKLYLYIDIAFFFILSIVYVLIPYIYSGLTVNEVEKFKVIYVFASLFSVISFPLIPSNGVLSAYEQFVPLKICDLFHKIFMVVFMSGCLLLGYGLYALVLVNGVSALLTFILKLLVIKRRIPLEINWSYWDKSELRSLFSFSLWVMIIALCQRLVLNICPSILGIMADSSSIAVFGVAMTIEGFVFSFANAINGLFLPTVSRYIAKGEDDSIVNLMIRVGRFQIVIIGLLLVGFVCVGQSFIDNWLGYDYGEVFWCALILTFPSFIYLPQEIANTTVVAKNEVKRQAYISIAKGVCNLILAFPLVKIWGVYGMATAVCVSYLLSIICMNILYKQRLGIDIGLFFRKSFVPMLPSIVISLVISLLVSRLVTLSGWIGVILRVITTAIIYLSILLFFGLGKDERASLYRVIHFRNH